MNLRKSLLNTMAVLLAAVVFAPALWAGEVKEREENQQQRIAQGVASGQLTAKETEKLEKGEAKIEDQRQAALADGKMTPKEKAKLNKAENNESKKIYHMKHNGRKAGVKAAPKAA